jgi:MerR HTH family regulatory protein
MDTETIALKEFCAGHQIEISFIQSLEEQGLVNIVIIDESLCVYANELPRLERIIRLHRELNINPEGIDVIDQLLTRMEDMQHEITKLKNRLDFYAREI